MAITMSGGTVQTNVSHRVVCVRGRARPFDRVEVLEHDHVLGDARRGYINCFVDFLGGNGLNIVMAPGGIRIRDATRPHQFFDESLASHCMELQLPNL